MIEIIGYKSISVLHLPDAFIKETIKTYPDGWFTSSKKHEMSMIHLPQTIMKIHHASSNPPFKNKLFKDEK
jgi:hypothetical protein